MDWAPLGLESNDLRKETVNSVALPRQRTRTYLGPELAAFRTPNLLRPANQILKVISKNANVSRETDTFFCEYTSGDAILKYTRATAGFGISYLLDHDYKAVYLQALAGLPEEVRRGGVRILEFGCGAGMNLLHLLSVLSNVGVEVETAIGTDFSPVLIGAARNEARASLRDNELQKVQFHVAKNEQLIPDLEASLGVENRALENSFHFILGVNTIRYCHAAKKEMENARDIFKLLAPGGICAVIDMNDRFPFFRSDLKNRFLRQKEEECYVPSLEEYAAPFIENDFEILRKEHFCWVPHSSGRVMCRVFSVLAPILSAAAGSRAMRSLVVSRKPA
jgi:SAM-dependent methyltransferase